MATESGVLTYTFRGVKYTRELPPVDKNAYDDYVTEYLEDNCDDPTKASGELVERAKRWAAHEERLDRIMKTREAIERENSDVIAKGDAPNDVVPNGGVASGDPGISQRRTTADPKLRGMKSEGVSTGNAESKKVITDADQLATLPTLADKLNKLVYAPQRSGFVTKAVKTIGNGSYLDQVVDLAYQISGHGHQNAQIAQVFSSFDRYNRSLALKNVELTGYTFITRPRLNLSDTNVAADRRFAGLNTTVVTDVAYGIRCMLDTQYCQDHIAEAMSCPLIDVQNPFAVLLCNALTSISGYMDPILATETTEGGFFQESQSYAIGGDRMARGYDFTLNFRDYPGSPVAAAFDYWYQYMMNLGDGSMIQYADAIDANRLDYTVSIYRFVVDRTRKMITKWSKATGCFPVNSPSGVVFNKGSDENVVTANDNFGINFKVNHIGYTNDPIILQEFNILVRRYLNRTKSQMKFKAYANEGQNNFSGIPYVAIGDFGYELVFLHKDDAELVSSNANGMTVSNSNLPLL